MKTTLMFAGYSKATRSSDSFSHEILLSCNKMKQINWFVNNEVNISIKYYLKTNSNIIHTNLQ
jgi:hypothetical protein